MGETWGVNASRACAGKQSGNRRAVTIPEALQYLQSLSLFGYQPGLDSVRRLAAAAGNPQDRLQFIHVAGTNGKGSVCAFLESVYRQSGRRVGLYTSPHLVRFGERIQINREPIPDDALVRWVGQLKAIAEGFGGPPPTFFEFTTVLALCHFAEVGVDLVVWETGLGGRLDATNIVSPLASVITHVGWDHMNVLGNTLAAIATEKAGIIKPGTPVLSAAAESDAEAIIRYRALELDAPYLHVGPSEVAAFRLPVGLVGPHQRTNAALAAATVRLLRVFLPVTDDQLQTGLATTSWPGRMQVVQRGSQKWILDGAHNIDGARALKAALPELVGSHRPTLILGVLADKEWGAMLREWVPLASRVITAPVASRRTVSAEELRAAAVATGAGRPVRAAASLEEALKLAGADPVVVVAGSLYFIGETMERLGLSPAAHGDERALNEWGGGTR
jgi:dihydrofolate synthase/folylpolyglutamate synthase